MLDHIYDDEEKDRKFENKDENNINTDIQILIQKYKWRKTKIVHQNNGLTIFWYNFLLMKCIKNW